MAKSKDDPNQFQQMDTNLQESLTLENDLAESQLILDHLHHVEDDIHASDKQEGSSAGGGSLNRNEDCELYQNIRYSVEQGYIPPPLPPPVQCTGSPATEDVHMMDQSQKIEHLYLMQEQTVAEHRRDIGQLREQLDVHLQSCTKFPMNCEHCGTGNILRDEMQHHLEVECPEAVKPCKFKRAGCSFKGKEDAMNEHDQSQKTEHLNLMLEFTSSKEQKEKNLTEKLEKVEQDNTSLQTQLSTHRETLAASTQDLRAYQTRLGKVEQTVAEHRRDIGQLRERLNDSAFEEIRAALAEQEVKLSALESEFSRGGSLAPSSGSRSLASSSSTLERRHDIQLAEHDFKIQMLEATSYDGTYIWKIDEFSRRHHEGIIGKTPSIYSPPFHVGRYGYKVCARVYLNGDGMGKGTHLSLFFVIMKGKYDALNQWPFRQKVTFKLLDHDRQNDISFTFRPDPKSSSFKLPTSNMNIASEFPLFVSQQDLQSRSYVNDDTLFIKITVETAGLPPV